MTTPVKDVSCMQRIYDFHNEGVMRLGNDDSCIVKALKINDDDHIITKIAKLITIVFTAIVNLIGRLYDCCKSDSTENKGGDKVEDLTKNPPKREEKTEEAAKSALPQAPKANEETKAPERSEGKEEKKIEEGKKAEGKAPEATEEVSEAEGDEGEEGDGVSGTEDEAPDDRQTAEELKKAQESKTNFQGGETGESKETREKFQKELVETVKKKLEAKGDDDSKTVLKFLNDHEATPPDGFKPKFAEIMTAVVKEIAATADGEMKKTAEHALEEIMKPDTPVVNDID